MKLTFLTLSIGNFYKVSKQLFLILKVLKKGTNIKKQEILIFSKIEWHSLKKKRHSLTDCDGCMKNLVYRKMLAKLPVTDKRLQ